MRTVESQAPDVWWSEMIKRGFVQQTSAEYQAWLALRAVRAEALEDIAKHIDQTADLAGEAADHKAEGVLRGVAENIRALTAGENRQ